MPLPEPQFLDVGHAADCRRIAYIVENRGETCGPGIMWLPGFKSEMTSTKVSALAKWAETRGVSMARLDYSGHGQSAGCIEDGTISRWLEEVRTVFVSFTKGPQIVVGSSMGGYLALLLLRQLLADSLRDAERIRGLVLIAPAWDMTERISGRLTEDARREIAETGVWYRPSRYGDGPYPVTGKLLEDGEHHLIGRTPFNPGRPVHILHGLQDPDVPWEHTLDLVAHLDGDWTRVTAVPDGDHRLSRPGDLELMLRTVEDASSIAPG